MSDSEENTNNPVEQESSVENGSPKEAPDSGGGGDNAQNKLTAKSDELNTLKTESENATEDDGNKTALLEQPIVIEGKRQRKKVERLSEKISEDQESEAKAKELVIPEGKGEALGSIPYVQYMLSKTKADELKLFHRILFGKAAASKDLKKNTVQFTGFGFEKESKDFEKKHEMVSRVFTKPLKEMLDLVGLEKGGVKEELVARLMAFLLKPHDVGRKVPEPKKKKGKKGKGKGTKRKRKSGVEKSKSGTSASSVTDDVSSDSGSESEKDDNDDDSGAEKEKSPPKKKAKKEEPKKAEPKKAVKKEEKKPVKKVEKAEKKASPKKKPATPKKPAAKKKVEEDISSLSSDSSDSDDNAPLVKKIKQPPTDDELREVIKKILEGADLEEITMKNVCKTVYDKYPEFDLVPRKSFIKAIVKELIN